MKRYYFLVTADEFELPVFVENSWTALARASGIHRNTLRNAFKEGRILFGKYKIEVWNFLC